MSERESRVLTTLDPAEYQRIERLSSSGCKQLLRSPAHYRAWKDMPVLATPAMQFGSVVHLLALEPQHVMTRVKLMPVDAPTRQSTAGKEWHAQFQRDAVGKIIISVDDFQRATLCVAALKASRGWSLLRPEGRIETSLLWKNGGALCKARPDYFSPDATICVDLKTTTDASREAFMRQLWNMRYDIQAAFYMDGLHATTGTLPHSFVWGVVESEWPHGVKWYRMGHSDLEIARADISIAATLYAECVASNTWPSYDEDVEDIRLPPWARGKRSNNPQEF